MEWRIAPPPPAPFPPRDRWEHKLHRAWVYWEQYNNQQSNRRMSKEEAEKVWKANVAQRFKCEYLEEFLLSYAKVPPVTAVFCKNVSVERMPTLGAAQAAAPAAAPRVGMRVGGGGGGGAAPPSATVKCYMLFRDGITPDYTADLEKTIDEKGPKKANRYVLSMWRCSRALGDAKLDMVELAWDTTLYALIGEELDPAECVVGAALENRARGGATLDMQLWFAVRDDKTCKAICSKLRELLNRRSKEVFEQAGGSRFGGSEAFVFPRFEKDTYYWNAAAIAAGDGGTGKPWANPGAPRTLGKDYYEEPGAFQGSPLGGFPDGHPLALPANLQHPAGVLVSPPPADSEPCAHEPKCAKPHRCHPKDVKHYLKCFTDEDWDEEVKPIGRAPHNRDDHSDAGSYDEHSERRHTASGGGGGGGGGGREWTGGGGGKEWGRGGGGTDWGGGSGGAFSQHTSGGASRWERAPPSHGHSRP